MAKRSFRSFGARDGSREASPTRLKIGRKMGNASRSVISMSIIHSSELLAGTSAETEIAKDSRRAMTSTGLTKIIFPVLDTSWNHIR